MPARIESHRRESVVDREIARRVAADRHEAGLAEADLPGIAHQHVEPHQRHEQDGRNHQPAHDAVVGDDEWNEHRGTITASAASGQARCAGSLAAWPAAFTSSRVSCRRATTP